MRPLPCSWCIAALLVLGLQRDACVGGNAMRGALILHDQLPGAETIGFSFRAAHIDLVSEGGGGVQKNFSSSDLRRMTAAVNGQHNSTYDMVLAPEQLDGQLYLPQKDWLGVGTWKMGLVFAHIAVYMCAEEYEVGHSTAGVNTILMLAVEQGTCVHAASRDFHVISVSAYAGEVFGVWGCVSLSRVRCCVCVCVRARVSGV